MEGRGLGEEERKRGSGWEGLGPEPLCWGLAPRCEALDPPLASGTSMGLAPEIGRLVGAKRLSSGPLLAPRCHVGRGLAPAREALVGV